MNPQHEQKIKKLSLIPVGLGKKKFSNNFLNDKNGINISNKNPNYGEYTFHYWIWKNYINNIETNWVGFCQYRKFFTKINIENNKVNFDLLKNNLITDITHDYDNYDCILGEQFSVENFKFIKFVKKNFIKIITSPKAIFYKRKRTIKFHFDIFHGSGNLDKAIDLLDLDNKEDFRKFVNSKTSFNPHNMFMCKKEFLKKYYESIFPWLEKCENLFGFDLEGYGMKRIYGFLAERYLSYWFSKYCRVKEVPILFKDLSDYKYL